MSELRGADVVARTLEGLGVTRVFTLSGNHIMPIFDALLGTKIEIIHVRQEAAAVHMADAWGRLTGEVGVALVTGGQGHSNAAAALFTAQAAESPVLLLSGHAGLDELGRGAFQEMPQADIARPMTKAAWTAQSTATLADDLTRAFDIALEGRCGPVHISLPVDLLNAKVSSEATFARHVRVDARAPSHELVQSVARAVTDAKYPLIICGPAMCDVTGRAAMQGLETAWGVPVIAMQSPRGINDPSLGCFAEVLAEADLVVLIGKPLDFTLKFGEAPTITPDCRLIVIDPDEALVSRARHALGDRVVASGIADARATIAALSSHDVTDKHQAWRARVSAALAYVPSEWDAAKASTSRVHPVELCRAIDAFFKKHGSGTLICDGGEIGQWPQALVTSERRLINGVSGTIGVSIPFAISAKLERPLEPVVAILGDGTFGFHMAEFDTAVRYGVPIIAVIGNDARWNAEYQIQLRSFGAERARHCDLLPTRYDQVVEALGGFGAFVTSAGELPDALERALSSGKPACVNVMIDSVTAPIIRRGN